MAERRLIVYRIYRIGIIIHKAFCEE